MPHCRDEGASLFTGDAVDTLAALPDASVDCVVSSPPYWGLRDYGIGGRYGQEPTADAYVDVLCTVFDQVARLLVDSGTLWLNVADSYGGSWGNYIAAGSGSVTARVAPGPKANTDTSSTVCAQLVWLCERLPVCSSAPWP